MTEEKELCLPFTNTGKKYGYITWRKKHDEKVKEFLGQKKSINIVYCEKVKKNKNIDWEKRRIGITYSLTRGVSSKKNTLKLSELNSGNFKLEFEG